ncbi:MAG TPA: hypothetical protein VME18_02265 [Acidobacteriaceae bacterium]|nr:hypothetical protein [Acidobacteriaceae bacterium]
MAGMRRISYLWQEPEGAREFSTAVSLHSHTNQSKETLDFLANLGNQFPLIRPFLSRYERISRERHGIPVNYAAAYWTPPLTPKLAFDLESGQIENKLGLRPLVSITDHDTVAAPMLLRTIASARHIPVSVEWSAPFGGDQSFHLGIHNLPSDSGAAWMKTFEEYTASPDKKRLTEILAALDELPNVLTVFNHPCWDLYLIGKDKAAQRVRDFLAANHTFLHAFELNGLRPWAENRAVRRLAQQWDKLLISGGDRHGREPNANVNLSNASSFTEFVHEIRYEGRSHVLFMPQYAQPWKHRILESTLDAIRDYPDFPLGSRRWDDRVWHPGADGVLRPASQLWASGQAPWLFNLIIKSVRLMGTSPVSGSLRLAWSESRELRFALGKDTIA